MAKIEQCGRMVDEYNDDSRPRCPLQGPCRTRLNLESIPIVASVHNFIQILTHDGAGTSHQSRFFYADSWADKPKAVV
jgi:hypothetical protein